MWPEPVELVAVLMLTALLLYVVFAGADFGGGVWDLLASGPRAKEQRALIEHAIAPVWEANHVWLIFVIVILFSAFPIAFSALTTALHVPLTLVLLGIVARGSAFVFRKYGARDDVTHRRWSRVFSISSLVTPLLLGAVIATMTAGNLRIVDGMPQGSYLWAWINPLSLCVGLFALALFAFLAAVFLTLEADSDALRDDFRLRALLAGLAVGVLALTTALVAGPTAARFSERLFGSWWSWPLQLVTGLASLGALGALWTRRYTEARIAAVTQVAMIVLGWGGAQYPYLIAPDVTLLDAAAPEPLLRLLAPVLWGGTLLLTPALYWLFAIFKTAPRA